MANNNSEGKLPPGGYVFQTDKRFNICEVTPTEVWKIISTIKESKATGYDRVSPKIVKDCADVIAHLSQIFLTNLSKQESCQVTSNLHAYLLFSKLVVNLIEITTCIEQYPHSRWLLRFSKS